MSAKGKLMTEQDDTWSLFYRKMKTLWDQYASCIHPYYTENLSIFEDFRFHAPSLDDINDILKPTGWSAVHVDSYTPGWVFSDLLFQRKFPVSSSIRPLNEVYFAYEPDFIHDVIGHLPPLLNTDFRDHLNYWLDHAAKIKVTDAEITSYYLNKMIAEANRYGLDGRESLERASENLSEFSSNNPSAYTFFHRLFYWWFEFGIIQHNDSIKVIGAGILSSPTELKKIGQGGYSTIPLTREAIMAPYKFSDLQNQYITAPSFEAYRDLVDFGMERFHPNQR